MLFGICGYISLSDCRALMLTSRTYYAILLYIVYRHIAVSDYQARLFFLTLCIPTRRAVANVDYPGALLSLRYHVVPEYENLLDLPLLCDALCRSRNLRSLYLTVDAYAPDYLRECFERYRLFHTKPLLKEDDSPDFELSSQPLPALSSLYTNDPEILGLLFRRNVTSLGVTKYLTNPDVKTVFRKLQYCDTQILTTVHVRLRDGVDLADFVMTLAHRTPHLRNLTIYQPNMHLLVRGSSFLITINVLT